MKRAIIILMCVCGLAISVSITKYREEHPNRLVCWWLPNGCRVRMPPPIAPDEIGTPQADQFTKAIAEANKKLPVNTISRRDYGPAGYWVTGEPRY